MKTILLLLVALLFLSFIPPVTAQSQGVNCSGLPSLRSLNGAVYQNPSPAINRHLRTTSGSGSRVTGQVDLNNDGATFVYYDSLILTYSGSRGGDLNHLGTQLKFDNAYIYYYNTTTTAWDINTYEFQTFDGSDNVLTTIAQLWHPSTSSWVNSAENLYTWVGSNLQSYVYQTWDTVSSMWMNSDKYMFTYDGGGNMLTEIDQAWNTSGSVWVNSYQYIYTYDASNKVTSEVDQNWDTSAHMWMNSAKYTYTYDVTGMYVLSQITQYWNSGTSTWDNAYQTINTYDGSNDRITSLSQNWSATVWVNSALATYSSFVAQLPQTEIDQDWNTGTLAFVNSSKLTYTYNSFNQLTDQVSETWNIGGFWQYTTSDRESRFHYQTYTTGLATVAANGGSAVIYPVPARETLHADIRWDEPQSFSAAIYNLQGIVLRQWDVPTCSNYNTDLPLDLPSGNYFIKFNGTNGSIVRQFAVLR